MWALDDQVSQRLSVFLGTRFSFLQALHGLFTNTSTTISNLQNLATFSKEILFCAVLETIIHAKSSRLSYSSYDNYKGGDLSSLSIKDPLLKAISFRQMLWPAQLHDYCDKSAPSHPEIESTILLLFAVVQLKQGSDTSSNESLSSREAVVVATEVFCSIANLGFHDIITHTYESRRLYLTDLAVSQVKNNSNTFSFLTHYCVAECAKEMDEWLGVVMEAGLEGNVDKYDIPLLFDISGALALNDMDAAVVWRIDKFPIMADMRDALVDTWAQLLGSREWTMSK